MHGIAQKMRYLEKSSTVASFQKGVEGAHCGGGGEDASVHVMVVAEEVGDPPSEVLEVPLEGDASQLPNGNSLCFPGGVVQAVMSLPFCFFAF